jgi:hypothetical protein
MGKPAFQGGNKYHAAHIFILKCIDEIKSLSALVISTIPYSESTIKILKDLEVAKMSDLENSGLGLRPF